MVKKPNLKRATTRELLEEVRERSQANDWGSVQYRRVQELLGVLPKELLDYKPEE